MAEKRSRGPGRRAPVLLRYRLPNGPAVFVGREREAELVLAAMDRAPVTLIAGPSGIGKTALGLHVVHRRLRKRAERVLYFAVAGDVGGGQLRHDVLHALSDAFRREPVAWGDVQGDPDALTSLLVEVAEQEKAWVVLDGVDGCDPDTLGLLVSLAAYARDSRWLVCGAMVPDLAALRGQAVVLDGLGVAELARLGESWAPQASEQSVLRAVHASAGSPWMLQQLLAGAGESSSDGDYLLEGLPSPARRFVQLAAEVSCPLPREQLVRVTCDPGDGAWEALRQRGLLRAGPLGWCLHPVVGQQARRAHPVEPEQRRALAHALLEEPGPHALVEALRLLVRGDLLDELQACLRSRAGELMSAGFTPSLWQILRSVRDPQLRGWQLECAAQLGNPTALTSVCDPLTDEPSVRLTWAAKLLAEGKVSACRAVVEQLLSAAPDIAQPARLTLVKCLCHQGAWVLAREHLAVPSALERSASTLGALVGIALGETVSHGELVRMERDVACGELPHHELASVFLALGQRSKALAVLAQIDAHKRGSHVALLDTRRALLLHARILVERGELTEAGTLIDAVRPYSRGASLLRPFLLAVDVERRLAAGALEGLGLALEQAHVAAAPVDVGCALRMANVQIRLAALRAVQARTAALAVRGSGIEDEACAQWRDYASARMGRHATAVTVRDTPASRVRTLLVSAALAMAERRWAEAAEAARGCLDHARRHQLRSLMCEACSLLADALICGGDTTSVARVAEEVLALAELMQARRFQLGATWLLALAKADVSPALLESLAQQMAVAPMVARRAQSLLGGSPSVDAIDALVIAAIRRAGVVGSIAAVEAGPGGGTHGDTPPWIAGWGLDLRHHTVWLPTGTTVLLDSSPLSWNLLETLATRGALSKEELASTLWPTEIYHPFTHDGRLQVAVRKIRDKLEADASKPTRLCTTSNGYRLGAGLRICDR